MKIIKGEYGSVTEYHVGDVIVNGYNTFFVANERDDRGDKVGYQLIDLNSGDVCIRTSTLLSMFEKVGNLGDSDDQLGELEVHAKNCEEE